MIVIGESNLYTFYYSSVLIKIPISKQIVLGEKENEYFQSSKLSKRGAPS